MKPNKNKLFSIFATIILLCTVSTTDITESVVIKRDRIFIADGGLIVKDLHTGTLNQCTAPPLLDPAGSDVTDLLATATDVVVKHDSSSQFIRWIMRAIPLLTRQPLMYTTVLKLKPLPWMNLFHS